MQVPGGFWVRGEPFVDDRGRVGLRDPKPYNVLEEFRRDGPPDDRRADAVRVGRPYLEFARLGDIPSCPTGAGVERVLGFVRRFGLLGLLPHKLFLWVDAHPDRHRVRMVWAFRGQDAHGFSAEPRPDGEIPPGALFLGQWAGATGPSGFVRVEELCGYFDGPPVRVGHPEFWHRYREPVHAITNTARWWADILRGLGHRRSRREALDALRGAMAVVVPDLYPQWDGRRRPRWGRRPTLGFSSPSLLGFMGLALAEDLAVGRGVLTCEACGRFFVSGQPGAAYCSPACRWRTQKRRQRTRG